MILRDLISIFWYCWKVSELYWIMAWTTEEYEVEVDEG